jgi:hypothetical protein
MMAESMTNEAVREAWTTLAQEVRTGVLLTMRKSLFEQPDKAGAGQTMAASFARVWT